MRRLKVRKTVLSLSEDPEKLIIETLIRTRGSILHAAHELGMNRETLRLWILRLELYPKIRMIREDAKSNIRNIQRSW